MVIGLERHIYCDSVFAMKAGAHQVRKLSNGCRCAAPVAQRPLPCAPVGREAATLPAGSSRLGYFKRFSILLYHYSLLKCLVMTIVYKMPLFNRHCKI
jgi:hypothetical protein